MFIIDPRCLLNFFFSGCCMHCWFHSGIQKKRSCDDDFHDCVMSKSLTRGRCCTVCLQVCGVSHFQARYSSTCVTERSLTDAKSIARIRFALNLPLLRNLQQLQTVAKRFSSSCDHFFFSS